MVSQREVNVNCEEGICATISYPQLINKLNQNVSYPYYDQSICGKMTTWFYLPQSSESFVFSSLLWMVRNLY